MLKKVGAILRGRKGLRLHWALVFVGVGACVLGLAYAVLCGQAQDAQRGGVVAVGLAFGLLFLDRGTAKRLLERNLKDEPEAAGATDLAKLQARAERLSDEIGQVRASLSALLDWQSKQNIPLFALSIAGELMAGFGDVLARGLGAPG